MYSSKNDIVFHVFQVLEVYQNWKGYNGLAIIDLLTDMTRATNILKFATMVSKGNPTVYQILSEELRQSSNLDTKTRQVILGKFFFFKSC